MSNTTEYLNNLLEDLGAKQIQKKITQCGKFIVNYDKCLDEGNNFDDCYHLYYQKFLQCSQEIDIVNKNINTDNNNN